jgi:small subunit ribosomal protein S16
MVKIRLSRGGVRRKPFYRIVVIDEREKGAGVPLDNIGFWQPSKDLIEIDQAKVKEWVAKGAKITKAVSDLIKTKK